MLDSHRGDHALWPTLRRHCWGASTNTNKVFSLGTQSSFHEVAGEKQVLCGIRIPRPEAGQRGFASLNWREFTISLLLPLGLKAFWNLSAYHLGEDFFLALTSFTSAVHRKKTRYWRPLLAKTKSSFLHRGLKVSRTWTLDKLFSWKDWSRNENGACSFLWRNLIFVSLPCQKIIGGFVGSENHHPRVMEIHVSEFKECHFFHLGRSREWEWGSL